MSENTIFLRSLQGEHFFFSFPSVQMWFKSMVRSASTLGSSSVPCVCFESVTMVPARCVWHSVPRPWSILNQLKDYPIWRQDSLFRILCTAWRLRPRPVPWSSDSTKKAKNWPSCMMSDKNWLSWKLLFTVFQLPAYSSLGQFCFSVFQGLP